MVSPKICTTYVGLILIIIISKETHYNNFNTVIFAEIPTNEDPKVKKILENLGLGKYSINFEKADMDYETFLLLSEDHLREMGLTLGARLKILKEIKRLQDKGQLIEGKEI